jgi:hypothetical protein
MDPPSQFAGRTGKTTGFCGTLSRGRQFGNGYLAPAAASSFCELQFAVLQVVQPDAWVWFPRLRLLILAASRAGGFPLNREILCGHPSFSVLCCYWLQFVSPMITAITVFALFGGLLAVAYIIVRAASLKAPRGFEDAEGFHRGSEPYPVMKEQPEKHPSS